MAIFPSFSVLADDAPEVTIKNYVRAETDLQMRNYVENMDAFGRFAHLREATDVSATIHFGGDPAQDNFIPIVPGWNYIVRMYQPRKEILEGTWQFPAPEPVMQ